MSGFSLVRFLGFGCLATLLGVVSCSDYQGVLVGHGVPSRQVDTVQVPSDTVALPVGFRVLDTLVSKDFTPRAGWEMRLALSLSATKVDSVALLGSFASEDSLRFAVTDSVGKVLPLGYSYAKQSDRHRQDLRVALLPANRYQLRWVWNGNPGDSRGLVAVGYSPAITGKMVTSYSLTENWLAPSRTTKVRASSWAYSPVPVYAGDSLYCRIVADSTLEAFLVNSAVFADFMLSPQDPAQFLYKRSAHGDARKLSYPTADTLYWLLHNPGTQALNLTDTLQVWRQLAP